MVKIKTKKEMNLPELIEWSWKNEFISSVFWTSNREEGFNHKAFFDVDGNFYTSDNFNFNDTFEVEIEEEITEDTKLPKLLAIFKYNENTYSEIHENKSINEILKLDRKLEKSVTKSIHLFEDDETLTLLWKKDWCSR